MSERPERKYFGETPLPVHGYIDSLEAELAQLRKDHASHNTEWLLDERAQLREELNDLREQLERVEEERDRWSENYRKCRHERIDLRAAAEGLAEALERLWHAGPLEHDDLAPADITAVEEALAAYRNLEPEGHTPSRESGRGPAGNPGPASGSETVERVVEAGRWLLREYDAEEEEDGFPFNFALRDAHRELRAALAALDAEREAGEE